MGSTPGDAFGLFVSSVEGQPVHRFGAPSVLIGATRDAENPRKLVYDTGAIVGIPHAEARLYAREYARLIADGALTERTADDFNRQEQRTVEVGAPREPLKPRASADKRVDDGPSEGGGQLG